ncbi:MAG: hypothetical protein A2509_06825 [Candidatus Edwardsbacteria bacterium RIFOXYD12_FULL_50_11]|uniref:Uncharacterized protein n=1 Tax=Candidatus Edwardsbacteria bacterium GWF2_54_11 TaxID=1817851 RepID=A0A1F5R3F3_9BACT|nr:MAG: hypothetical protein A2502_09790 [Candidatus Edwardsbacteria bacterium RifOxyC12_full_54_24]OGF06863.1 MAG: hypothetical protein A2273_01270 [Candidatus Edwardsbacteria bacterium RifOxyA12_full_54_48]OGF08929.1 MAG: hypothetical protein A2024_01530 [Candidatus Edwardsbacteria bacterium GWF2_54_11]OGF10813.1 MAG: hypothetical protein A3K15_06640 [Candidatus Edwardsbacteria bacterium GWE2_54_12]OGF15593.1 MAG: hypothetical protein A2509_06825 [Candidatus Edwardsbacteria bacterium RIFOXYD1
MVQYREHNETDKRTNLLLLLFALILIAVGGAYLAPLKWPFGLVIFLGFIAMLLLVLAKWQTNKFGYRCPACTHEFDIKMINAFLTPHVWGKKYLKCPECYKSQWAIEIIKIK